MFHPSVRTSRGSLPRPRGSRRALRRSPQPATAAPPPPPGKTTDAPNLTINERNAEGWRSCSLFWSAVTGVTALTVFIHPATRAGPARSCHQAKLHQSRFAARTGAVRAVTRYRHSIPVARGRCYVSAVHRTMNGIDDYLDAITLATGVLLIVLGLAAFRRTREVRCAVSQRGGSHQRHMTEDSDDCVHSFAVIRFRAPVGRGARDPRRARPAGAAGRQRDSRAHSRPCLPDKCLGHRNRRPMGDPLVRRAPRRGHRGRRFRRARRGVR
jgi:hypothetical protein